MITLTIDFTAEGLLLAILLTMWVGIFIKLYQLIGEQNKRKVYK